MKNEKLEIHHLVNKKNKKSQINSPKNLRLMSRKQHKKQFGKKGRK